MPGRDRQLRLRLLGSFELTRGGHVLLNDGWPRRKARSLIKLLALAPARSLHREVVFDLLWPRLRPAAAANNLRQTLHQIRKTLAGAGLQAAFIGTTVDTVSLSSAVVVDVDDYVECAARARASDAGIAVYEDALARYGGDLLPADAYEPWTEPYRERLRMLRRELLVELSDRHLQDGNHGAAESRLQEAVDADALDEDLHRRLMRLYASGGRYERALRQYQTLRELFARELGVAPSAETQALLLAIKRERA